MSPINGSAPTGAALFLDSSGVSLNSNASNDFNNTYGNATAFQAESVGPMHTVIPMTVLYVVTFLLSAVGNTVTCVVIVYNRYMHTATNYYLFSMSVSDLLLLLTGLPFELYSFWVPSHPYVFGEPFCVGRGLSAETSTNASILTIVFFTVERYLAICHPLLQQTMSSLPRTVRNIALIWVLSLLCACFPAAKFGIKYHRDELDQIIEGTDECNVVRHLFPHVFAVLFIIFFVVPMLLITVLYVQIGLRLRRSGRARGLTRSSVHRGGSGRGGAGGTAARKAVVKMLVAVVVAFFICWAPFHAQRLMIIYAPGNRYPALNDIKQGLHYVSGILYFVSTCVNPILYHMMSAKFRQAVRDTFGKTCHKVCCRTGSRGPESSVPPPSTDYSSFPAAAGDGAAEKARELGTINGQDANTRDPLLARHGTTVTRV
ncbi:pyrokinin-1 receptor-like [Pollicipes pollicipes]|uniref:pyrokinin-1 receptor-like n=1 Tax=Pollicipes pollicipes TaxID=41117 RepID=UPI001884AA1C|nr:pyrokinin-1 receptor-like [Pollicipes pollicipes]